ncbi:MAG: response regulator [Syntrophales bacterium]
MDNADILIVEDNRHDAELILEALDGLNIGDRVRAIYDGVEAVDYFFGPEGFLEKAGARLPKLLLLDLKLPKMSGLEILSRIKSDERTMDVPTVIFTSSSESQDRIESYRLGANSYIVKPMDADMFSRYVHDIGKYWLSMNTTIYDGGMIRPRQK